MTDQELKDIVAAVVAELEKSGVDFDYKADQAKDDDLVFVIRGTAPNYQGVTVTWKGLLDIITAQATQAKNDAETAKNAANTILEQVQSKGTEITNFVATSKAELETQKNESVNAVKSVYQTDLNELKGDLSNLNDYFEETLLNGWDSSTSVDGGLWDGYGTIAELAGWSYSETFVKVKPNTLYVLKYSDNGGSTWKNVSYNSICWYTKNKTFIKQVYNKISYTSPENAYYARISVRNDYITRFIISENFTNTYYPFGYYYSLNEDVSIPRVNRLEYEVDGIKTDLNTLKNDSLMFSSNNLYDLSYCMDGYLLMNNTGNPAAYETSIISGWFPMKEGHTYTITNGKNADGESLTIPAIIFYDENKNAICADSHTGIPNCDGLVNITNTSYPYVRTFKILEGSNIAYAQWYISKNGNYYGSHSGTDGIIDYVQVNEGTELLPFDRYAKGFSALSDKIGIIEEETKDLSEKIDSFSPSSRVVLTKNKNTIAFRSEWDSNTDMSIRCTTDGSYNKSFNINNYYLVNKSVVYEDVVSGSVWKSAGDDIAPAHFNNSYIGANHGWDKAYIVNTSSNHGATVSNIGETWTDSNGNNLVLLQVLTNNQMIFCCPNDNDGTSNLSIVTIGDTITNGSLSATISSVTRSQIYPSTNHKSVIICDKDGNEIIEDGVYKSEYFDVVESYDVYHVPSMIEYLQSNIGHNDNNSLCSDAIVEKYCTFNLVYRFTERGVITIFESIDFAKNVSWDFAHFTQCLTIGNWCVTPNSHIENGAELGSDSITISQGMWNNLNVPPNRFYQYTDSNLTKGFCCGFLDDVGNAVPDIQKESSQVGFYYGPSKKMYPELNNKSRTVNAGESINAVAYRIPLDTYDVDLPSVGWFYVGDDIYLVIDAQTSVDKYILLPKHMSGRKISVKESYGSFDVPVKFVTAKGIRIKVNTYGSAILKLTK